MHKARVACGPGSEHPWVAEQGVAFSPVCRLSAAPRRALPLPLPLPPRCAVPSPQTPELSAQQQEEYPRLIQHNHRATALYGDGGCASIVLPQPGRDLSTVVSHAHDRAVGVAEHVLQSSGAPPGCINLDTGNFFFRVTVSRWERAAAAAAAAAAVCCCCRRRSCCRRRCCGRRRSCCRHCCCRCSSCCRRCCFPWRRGLLQPVHEHARTPDPPVSSACHAAAAPCTWRYPRSKASSSTRQGAEGVAVLVQQGREGEQSKRPQRRWGHEMRGGAEEGLLAGKDAEV